MLNIRDLIPFLPFIKSTYTEDTHLILFGSKRSDRLAARRHH